MIRALALASLVLAAAAPTRAADVPVQYVVDQKALKLAVAGTVLEFELHLDAACTFAIDSVELPVEDVMIERIALVRPKGAPKAAKAARITATLAGVPPSGPTFLRVVGAGIQAVGGPCQAQGSFAQAPGGRTLFAGNETVLEGMECGYVFLSTSGAVASDIVAFHIVAADDSDVPSIDNDTAFVPATVAKTSQGGVIARGAVCNLSWESKTLPVGWKAVRERYEPVP
jgi:hypothetical protein